MIIARYPNYRPTGVGWLGAIPEHWNVEALRFAATFNDETLPETTDPDLPIQYIDISSISYEGGVERVETMSFGEAPSRARRVVRDGDTIVSTVRTYLRAVATIRGPDDDLIVSTGFVVLRPSAKLDGDFLGYFAKSQGFVGAVVAQSVGVSYPATNASEVVRQPIVYPPVSEQRAIVRFLDTKTAEIDALIAKKLRLLGLLAEQRLALITKAVTKGLDPNAPMKPSGLSWLGDVPAHWEVKRLDLLNDPYRPIMYGIVLPGPSVDDGVPIIKGGDVRPDRLTPTALSKTTFEIDEAHARSRVRAEDIVYAIRGSYGDAEIVPEVLAGANLTQDTARIAPIESISTAWLLYALKSEPTRQQLASRSLGATIKGVNIRDLKRAMLAVPPALEQAAIAQHLSALDERNRRLQSAVELHIERLKEMRCALITAAVTGQIDVHGWVPRKAAA